MVVRATFEPERVVSTDGPASLTLHLHNEADAAGQVHLKPVGELAMRTVLQTESVRLGAGERFDLPVIVDADRRLAAGSHTCVVEVSSDDGGHTMAEATLDVEAHAASAVTLIPERSRSATAGRHRIRVDNQGNVPVRVDVATSPATMPDRRSPHGPQEEPPPSATVDVATPATTVEPWQTGRIDVRVRPNSTFWTGPSRLHDFQIDAVASSGETFLLVGQYEQIPRIRPWLVPALVGAALALVLGALAWFALLRPTVEDIAEDAADTAAEANRIVIDDKIEELDQAAAEVAELPLGEPVDLRLAVEPAPGESDVDTFPVEAGRIVSVTDVVLQNPTGAIGTVSIRRDGVVLLESQLANFRDLDFHFVSAFRFEGASAIELDVSCDTAGPGNETCPVGATLTGFVDDG
jgi:hypothetical protein